MSDPLAFLEQTVCDDGSVDFTRCTAKHRQTNKELASDEDADILSLSAANAAAAISGAFVVNGSPTQTAMADRAGARTQFAQFQGISPRGQRKILRRGRPDLSAARRAGNLRGFLLLSEAVQKSSDPEATLMSFLESTYYAAADLASEPAFRGEAAILGALATIERGVASPLW